VVQPLRRCCRSGAAGVQLSLYGLRAGFCGAELRAAAVFEDCVRKHGPKAATRQRRWQRTASACIAAQPARHGELVFMCLIRAAASGNCWFQGLFGDLTLQIVRSAGVLWINERRWLVSPLHMLPYRWIATGAALRLSCIANIGHHLPHRLHYLSALHRPTKYSNAQRCMCYTHCEAKSNVLSAHTHQKAAAM